MNISRLAAEQITLETKYAGYIRRQRAQIERQDDVHAAVIPDAFDFFAIPQLRAEAKQKLSRIQPRSVGQASRISGITPADIAVLIMYVKEPQRFAS